MMRPVLVLAAGPELYAILDRPELDHGPKPKPNRTRATRIPRENRTTLHFSKTPLPTRGYDLRFESR